MASVDTLTRAVLNGCEYGLCVLDAGGILLGMNRAAEVLLGVREQDWRGRGLPQGLEGDGEIHWQRGDGDEILLNCRLDPIRVNGEAMALLHLHAAWPTWPQGAFCDIESNFRAILDTITDAVIVIDAVGTIRLFNPAAEHMFGYRRDEAIGHNVNILMNGSDRIGHDGYLAEYHRTGVGHIIGVGREVQGLRRDGKTVPLYLSIGEMRQGEQRLFVGILHDLTRRKQAEEDQRRQQEALRESEARFSRVAEMVGEWLWEQDAEGRYLYCSAAVEHILGYRPEEIVGRSYLDLLTEGDRRQWREHPISARRSHAPFHKRVNHYRHRDGYEVYTESSGEPLFDSAGRVVRWRGMDLDITARKRFEDALRLRERAIEAANVGIAIADARVEGYPNLYVNPALLEITGYAREELLGRNLKLLQGPDTDPAAIATIRRAIYEGTTCEVVLRNYRKDGTPFWNELLLSPVRDDSGAVTHYIGIQTDVTERRRAEEERHELEIAKQIQLSLLPKAPLRLPGVEIAGVCIPATHVGGDYFDYFPSGGHVDLVIADVSGHSVGAALIMAETRSTLKAEIRRDRTRQPLPGPAELLYALNDVLYGDLSGAELFITMFYLRYEPASYRLRYANAGHNRALLLRRERVSCTELDAEGLILGVRREVAFEEKTTRLEPGDRLLLYTDGVVEAQNDQGEFFGLTRLCQAFVAQRAYPPEVMIERLLGEVRAFRGRGDFQDDISMVLLRVG